MRVQYVGPLRGGVEIYPPDSVVETVVPHMGTVEVDAEYGASLLDQPSNWQMAEGTEPPSGDGSPVVESD